MTPSPTYGVDGLAMSYLIAKEKINHEHASTLFIVGAC